MTNSCDPHLTLDFSNATKVPKFMVYNSTDWITYYVVWPCTILFGLFNNLTFIWTVIRTPALQTATFKYLISLAISDLLTLLCLVVPGIVQFSVSPLTDIPPALSVLFIVFFLCSIETVTLVSLERFSAICYPLKHRLLQGSKRTNILICVTWAIAFGISVPVYLTTDYTVRYCVIWPSNSRYDDFPTFYRIEIAAKLTEYLVRSMYIFFFIVALALNFYTYTKMYIVMKKRTNQRLNSSVDTGTQFRQVVNMLIVNGVLYFVFLFIQIFMTIVNLLLGALSDPSEFGNLRGVLSSVGKFSVVINACVNPIIFLVTNKRYRDAFKGIFNKICANKRCQQRDISISPPQITISLK